MPTETRTRSRLRNMKTILEPEVSQRAPQTNARIHPPSNSATMRANVFHAPNQIRVEEVPHPHARAGEAVIRITLTTICGTDLHILRGEYPVKPGLVIGHEPVGVIEELGEGIVRIQNRRTRARWCDHTLRSMSRLFVRAMVAMRSRSWLRSDRRLAIRKHD